VRTDILIRLETFVAHVQVSVLHENFLKILLLLLFLRPET